MNKPFIERLKLDKINLKILEENRLKVGGFSLFKSTFFGQLWNMVKINWLMLAFCIPIVICLIFGAAAQLRLDSLVPYSANMNPYPIVNYAKALGAIEDFYLNIQNSALMILAIIFAAVGLAGVFNVVKYLCWGMSIKIVKTFFKGIKNSFTPFAFIGLLLSICYILIVFCRFGLSAYNANIFVKILAIAFTVIITFYVLTLSIFVFTQSVMFDLTTWEILKNAFLLTNKFIIQNLIICIVSMLLMPLIFFSSAQNESSIFISIIKMIPLMIFFMGAFSYMATVFTVYSHGIYMLVYEVLKKNTVITVEASNNNTRPKKKVVKPPYQNPKKKKK